MVEPIENAPLPRARRPSSRLGSAFKEKGLISTHYHKIKIPGKAGLEAEASPLTACLRGNLF